MNYLYQEGTPNGKKFILLHGTGGDETSLLELAKFLDADSTILSFRGKIEEEGMNRFFKRNGLNQFDFESLEKETDNLQAVIKDISEEKNIPLEDWVLVGYSNGANIAAHLLLERETALTKGIFFHPMSLEVHTQTFDLKDKHIWVSYGGDRDPIVSDASFAALVAAFQDRSADITVVETGAGHQVTMDEVQHAHEWLQK